MGIDPQGAAPTKNTATTVCRSSNAKSPSQQFQIEELPGQGIDVHPVRLKFGIDFPRQDHNGLVGLEIC